MPENQEGLYRATYQLPSAFRGRLAGKQVAIVDDVMSAGSALRGTYAALLRMVQCLWLQVPCSFWELLEQISSRKPV